MDVLLPMNLKVHSEGMTLVMWVSWRGRWGSARVSTMNASLVGSRVDDGEACSVFVEIDVVVCVTVCSIVSILMIVMGSELGDSIEWTSSMCK